MEIPKSFKLGNKEWAVVETQGRPYLRGQCFPQYAAVHLCVEYKTGVPMTPRKRSETFWHEVTHAILYDMGDPRWKDEKFVLAFSKRLNQVINTAVL